MMGVFFSKSNKKTSFLREAKEYALLIIKQLMTKKGNAFFTNLIFATLSHQKHFKSKSKKN